jgi:ligand-binding sensor domain-containing protein
MGAVARACCAAFGASVLSVAHAQVASQRAPERVLETFEVGEGVYVRALRVDPETRTLWVGTSAGVHEIDLATLKPRHTFTRKDGLANEYVFAIGLDRERNVWFGTNAGGASRYRAGRWKTYFPMHGLADYWVYAFANSRDGSLWIGTWAGASRFDAETGTFRNYVKELVNPWVYGIAVDAAGRVWFGTEGGVSMFDGKTWKAWTHADGLGAPNRANLPPSANTGLGTRSRHDLTVSASGGPTYNPGYVFSILSSIDGRVWAGTWGGGASRFDGRKWINFTSRDGLAGDIVYSIAQDAKGVLWFGTDAGVSRFDGKTWRSLRRGDGLLDDNVYALAAGPGGEMWAGTRRGVAHIGER